MIAELLTLLAVAVTTVVLMYTLAMFRDWVKTHVGNYRNRELLSGLLRERLDNGDYKVVPFLFDKHKKEVLEKDAYQTPFLDEDIEDKFKNEDIFVEEIKYYD